MRSSPLLIMALLVVSSGCAPIADNRQGSGADSAGETARSPAPDHGATASDGGSATLPFIAETRSPVPVIDVATPGRLEVVDGCLTVTIEGSERATAVFPPGVKPELRGDEIVAVSFEGRRIPLGQETPIPGGGVRLSSAELVKPIPSYCPKTLFGLGG